MITLQFCLIYAGLSLIYLIYLKSLMNYVNLSLIYVESSLIYIESYIFNFTHPPINAPQNFLYYVKSDLS